MEKTDFIQVRIEPEFKEEVEDILNQLGIRTTDAINMFLKQIVLTKGIPFNVQLPAPHLEKRYRAAEELYNSLDSEE